MIKVQSTTRISIHSSTTSFASASVTMVLLTNQGSGCVQLQDVQQLKSDDLGCKIGKV